MIGKYENRIREFSTPEKIFDYFASVTKRGERFMNVTDFLRAITPYDFRESSAVGTDAVSRL